MSTAHTPGPWKANFKSLATVEAENGAVVAKVQRLGSLTTMQADQRLIAAAPELLAAATRAEAFIASFDDDNKADDVAGMLRDLRAAIAKVTGEAS